MEEIYEYTALPTPTSIRLLRIGPLNDEGIICCTIKTVDLLANPWYHAYSYTWSNPLALGRSHHAFTASFHAQAPRYLPSAQHKILINGRPLYINTNLYDAFCDVPKDAWKKVINRPNRKRGWTKLHVHAVNGDVERVKACLWAGAEVDAKDLRAATALIWAVMMGKLEAMRCLVEHGADVNIVDAEGLTALDHARRLKHADIEAYLEEATRIQEGMIKKTSGEGPEIWAWIDQICINQQDLDERRCQVGIMNEIYTKAFFTLVWLGKEDEWTKAGVGVIAKLANTGERFVNSKIVPYSTNDEEVFIKADILYISYDEWESLATIFQRQYFRRVWVVQENILSNVMVGYCGGTEIPWADFCTVTQLLLQRQAKIGRPMSALFVPMNEATQAIEDPVFKLAAWKERWTAGEKASNPRAVSEQNLLFDTWQFRATDPRDNIYGVYGLLRLGLPGSVTWKVDYRKSVEQVFAETTKRLMEEEGTFSMMSAVVDHEYREIKQLPSWTPDYSLIYASMMCSFFQAAGSLPVPSPLFSPLTHWNELRISGTRVDTVFQTGTPPSGAGDIKFIFNVSWLELALLIPSTYHSTGQTRTEALWRTLCANHDLASKTPAPSTYQGEFQDMMSIMVIREAWLEEQTSRREKPDLILRPALESAVEYTTGFWAEPPFSELKVEDVECEFSDPARNLSSDAHQGFLHTLLKLHILSITESHNPCTPTLDRLLIREQELKSRGAEDPLPLLTSVSAKTSEFVNVLRARLGRRRLFVTGNRYLGLGPKGLRINDEIWVFPGGGAAYALRKIHNEGDSDARYMFVGETYVHGIMCGEAVEGGDITLKEITLV